jgi:hypothetical protein
VFASHHSARSRLKKHMLTSTAAAAIAALALAAALASAQRAAASPTPATVDFGDCVYANDGVASVPAGEPITVTDTGGGANGTYGLALHTYQSGVVTATIAVSGGTTTTIPLAVSFPEYFGDPYYAWLTFTPDIPLDALASGGSVLVTIDSTFDAASEAVFAGQGYPAPHFGPFHIDRGTSEQQCLISADS